MLACVCTCALDVSAPVCVQVRVRGVFYTLRICMHLCLRLHRQGKESTCTLSYRCSGGEVDDCGSGGQCLDAAAVEGAHGTCRLLKKRNLHCGVGEWGTGVRVSESVCVGVCGVCLFVCACVRVCTCMCKRRSCAYVRVAARAFVYVPAHVYISVQLPCMQRSQYLRTGRTDP